MSIEEFCTEFGDVIMNFTDYHAKMNLMLRYYQNSVFYKPKSGQIQTSDDLQGNLLKVLADKNIFYTSGEPTVKVPGTPEDRTGASYREKLINYVRWQSGMGLIRRRQARDATLLSATFTEVEWDAKMRCARINRFDPRYCFWQLSNDNSRRVVAFWVAYPITLDEAKKVYGVTPTGDGGIPMSVFDHHDTLKRIDGKDWYMFAKRWDGKTKMAVIGNKIIEPMHDHGFSGIPIDACIPFDECNDNNFGSFFIEPLLPSQAELNHVLSRRSAIVDRMASPVIWGRNIIGRGFDDVKANLSSGTGGFAALGRSGELGILQMNETKMLDVHEEKLIQQMMRLSGFGAASFGESVGANTSGDALGMYFTPTQRLLDDQNIAWVAMDQSINSKIIEAYLNNMTAMERLTINGYAQGGTILALEDGSTKYQQGAFSLTFTKYDLGTSLYNISIPRPVTPKDEIEEKRFALEAANLKIISRTTAYEMMKILSPEDEMALLEQEQSNPLLNPDGVSTILQGAQPAAPSAGALAEKLVPNGAQR